MESQVGTNMLQKDWDNTILPKNILISLMMQKFMILGQCSIVEYEDYIYIFMIEIYESKRRKGYATEVVNYLKSKKKTIKLNVSMNDNPAISY